MWNSKKLTHGTTCKFIVIVDSDDPDEEVAMIGDVDRDEVVPLLTLMRDQFADAIAPESPKVAH